MRTLVRIGIGAGIFAALVALASIGIGLHYPRNAQTIDAIQRLDLISHILCMLSISFGIIAFFVAIGRD